MKRTNFVFIFLFLISNFVFAASDFSADFYGFIRANNSLASRSVNSFGNANESAPTSNYPEQGTEPTKSRNSFQVSQTRVGVNLQSTPKLSGVIELDFIDFAKATPVTSAVPRLRIAAIQYHLLDGNTVEIGQDWDVFSPGKPFTFNPVALYFEAGNSGFMRPQFRWNHEAKTIYWQAALGFPNKNASAPDSDYERGLLPTASAMVGYHLSETDKLGFSGIVTTLSFAGSDTTQTAYGLDAFFEGKLSSDLQLHAATYYGANLASIYGLTLANASATESHNEWGGYATAQWNISGEWKMIVGVGGAIILDSTGSIMTGPPDTRRLSNLKASIGIAYDPIKNLEFFIESSEFVTRFKKISTSEENTLYANVSEVGATYTF